MFFISELCNVRDVVVVVVVVVDDDVDDDCEEINAAAAAPADDDDVDDDDDDDDDNGDRVELDSLPLSRFECKLMPKFKKFLKQKRC